ncbi:DUF5134 domain-containing protein [Streptomyces sp. NBC_00513]|uniref:DUF5134 domain-containing protein n=1 Tax=unclassified Streptomyces TaxID=2593676 RepID=UPI00225125F7|nr:DUF5134 domain-containing protein [Streptomyces sp. NBC_00424]MCX5076803.1 DUF5134 domain-containing protein [Streptomyces sp. NBC_00424]WUD40183.1 DUF5134 domain-containing protein [Streptomyces sp. NBC_00513]
MSSISSVLSAWLLVLLCAVSGTYCLLRASRAGGEGRGPAAGEAVMGLGMAVMAVPPGTGAWGARILLGAFCGAALHALWLLRDGAHHTHHLVGSLAMAYMAYQGLAMTAGHGHGPAVGAARGMPLVTGVLLVYFTGYVLLAGARLMAGGGGRPVVSAAGGQSLASAVGGTGELTRACRLAMGIGMLAMLPGM